MLFNHLKYYNVLQVGIHVAISLMGVCDVVLGTAGVSLDRFSSQKNRKLKLKFPRKLFDNKNILCLQEVHGKDEYLQAIQVLAPRFRFFLVPSFLKRKRRRIGFLHQQGTSA